MDKPQIGRILYTEKQIQQRVSELGQKIVNEYLEIGSSDDNKHPLVLIGVLNGSIMFLSDLVKAINKSYSKIYGYDSGFIAWDTVSISTRTDNNKQKKPIWLLDPKMSLAGLDVLLVEDIVDTGKTARYVMSKLNDFQEKPHNLRLCTLLDRVSKRKVIALDYVGFKLKGNKWVLGYGMDTGGWFRNLPYIAVCEGC
jgi:hypoxanthine phosphoribosyltransferase